MPESEYIDLMKDYFRRGGKEEYKKWMEYLKEAKENGKLLHVFGSMFLGMYIRNFMREKCPQIDKDYPNYCDFEDYSWELFQKIVAE